MIAALDAFSLIGLRLLGGAIILACGIIVVFQLIFPRRVKGRQITSVRRWE